MKSQRPFQKKLVTGLVAGLAVFALAACTGNDSSSDNKEASGGTSEASAAPSHGIKSRSVPPASSRLRRT